MKMGRIKKILSLGLAMSFSAMSACSLDSLVGKTPDKTSSGIQQLDDNGNFIEVDGKVAQIGGSSLDIQVSKQKIFQALKQRRQQLLKNGFRVAATSASAARLRIRITFLEGAVVLDPGKTWVNGVNEPGARTIYFGMTRANTATGYFPWPAAADEGVNSVERLIYATPADLSKDPVFPGQGDPEDPSKSPILGRVLLTEHRDSTNIALPSPYLSIFGGGMDESNLGSTCGGIAANCRGGGGATNTLPPLIAPFQGTPSTQAAGGGGNGPNKPAPLKTETFAFASKKDMPGNDGIVLDILSQGFTRMFPNATTAYDHPLAAPAMVAPLTALPNMYSRTHVYDFTVNDGAGNPGTGAITALGAGQTLEGIPTDFQAPPVGRGLPFGRAIIDVRVADSAGDLIQWAAKYVEFVQGGTTISFNGSLTNVGDPSTPLTLTF